MKKLIASALVSVGVIAGGTHLYQKSPTEVNLPDLSGTGSTVIEAPRSLGRSLKSSMVFGDSLSETNYPVYIDGQYYVWESNQEGLANAALNYINNSGLLPLIGSNSSGVPQPDKQKTMRWTDEVLEIIDGRFCFERIPEKTLDYMGVPVSNRVAYLEAFQPSIEMYGGTNWFPATESE